MNADFDELKQMVEQAHCACAVFGALGGEQAVALRRRFRELAQVAHPDHNHGRAAEATALFQALHGWLRIAEQELADGSYGQTARFVVESRANRYTVDRDPVQGDLADLFGANLDGTRVLLKAVRSENNVDLMRAEAEALPTLARALDGQPVQAHFPTLVEQFQLADSTGVRRTTNVLREEKAAVTLAAVVRAYPRGLPLADAAWMFNRMLTALAISHANGLVHGAVLLPHMLIRPDDHNGTLIDWCYSVASGDTIRSISPTWRAEYPPEVLARQAATPATDIFMAGRCMVRLLGGTGDWASLPTSTPPTLRRLLQTCLLPAPARRSNDAWQVFDDFKTILQTLYGPPSFQVFAMPI